MNQLYSSVFREMKKYSKDFSGWCGECEREKKERQRQSVTATKLVGFSHYCHIIMILRFTVSAVRVVISALLSYRLSLGVEDP